MLLVVAAMCSNYIDVCMFHTNKAILVCSAGLEDGHLDQLALQLMTPVAKLQEYIDLVSTSHTL